MFQRGTPPEAVYIFKHALIQDAAHGSLLRGARQQLHARIAEALETEFPAVMETQPEILAQHYAEAGLTEKSVTYWGRAGHNSAARSAMAEAASQLQKGLDQLTLLPDTPERQRQELEFWSALGAAARAVKSEAAPETGHAYARARELWQQLGSPPEFLHVPHGQSRYHANRGELESAQRLAEDLLRLSRQRNQPAGLVLGHYSSGRNLMFSGRFASSRVHLEEAHALHDPTSRDLLIQQAGDDAQVGSQSFMSIVLFCTGFPDQAVARSSAAIAEARRLAHLPSLAHSLVFGARLHSLGGDNAAFRERLAQLVAMTTEKGFPIWPWEGRIFSGWDKIKNGHVVEGISLLRSGSAAYRTIGRGLVWVPYHLALLAKACESAGQVEEAMASLDEALQIVERTGVRWLEAELDRHKGQLLLGQEHTEAAEELYHKALGVARDQEAKLWELRTAGSLARLRRDQGRRAEARDLLAPVYLWFTEGFDTPDLKDAKALLDELA